MLFLKSTVISLFLKQF